MPYHKVRHLTSVDSTVLRYRACTPLFNVTFHVTYPNLIQWDSAYAKCRDDMKLCNECTWEVSKQYENLVDVLRDNFVMLTALCVGIGILFYYMHYVVKYPRT